LLLEFFIDAPKESVEIQRPGFAAGALRLGFAKRGAQLLQLSAVLGKFGEKISTDSWRPPLPRRTPR
jgi:hypothetical protein